MRLSLPPPSRATTADVVAEPVMFLARVPASHVTVAAFKVNGGPVTCV
ncbi:MAG TPA: hypothetical protein VNI02_20150 [Blastocatellia bacterium]|nr:hypothetical protein [Blastocatellia bacterium]